MVIPIFNANPWTAPVRPKKILVMRFQAMGDMVITLPYLQDLKNKLGEMEIDFLTRREVCGIAENLAMFSKVIVIDGGRNMKLQLLSSLAWIPFLWWRRYDVVIDLQNHRLSRIIRQVLCVKHFSVFDRSSPVPAGERTRHAINNSGMVDVSIANEIKLNTNNAVEPLMKRNGWTGGSFVILNPAGAFESRNWQIDNYLEYGKMWLSKDPRIQFLILGFTSLSLKASQLKTELGNSLIDLSGMTTPAEAFEIVRKAKLVLSEDSGLMHMAWTQRVPTIAIFGSTPGVWSTPLGEWSYCFNSSDLPCGNCFLEKCRFDDNHCLTRWTAQVVFEKSLQLLPDPSIAKNGIET